MGETGAVLSYWNDTAHKKSDTRALAARLGLQLPDGLAPGIESGLMYPMRRLIIAGEDTPEKQSSSVRAILGSKHCAATKTDSSTGSDVSAAGIVWSLSCGTSGPRD